MSSSEPKVTLQKEKSCKIPPKILYENRYCNQDDFSILVCGGLNENGKIVRSVFKLHGSKLKHKNFTSMPYARSECKTVVINSELIVLGGYSQNNPYDKSVRKFSNTTKTWSCKTQLLLGNSFCVCSFKKNLYVFSGPGICCYYNLKLEKWFQISSTNKSICKVSCSGLKAKLLLLKVLF